MKAAFDNSAALGLTLRFQTRVAKDSVAPEWIFWSPEVPLVGHQALLEGPEPPTCLVNFAGVTPGQGDTKMSDNTALALAALEAAADLGIPHVFLASSAAVYGVPSQTGPLTETADQQPTSGYGRAKLEMEQASLDWMKTKSTPTVTVLRIGNVAGADQLLQAAWSASPEQPLILDQFENGQTPQRSYIGPESLARVLVSLGRAVASGKPLPKVLNISAPGHVDMLGLLTAWEAAGHAVDWRFHPAPTTAIPKVELDTSRLEALHSFAKAESDPAEMIRQVIASQGHP